MGTVKKKKDGLDYAMYAVIAILYLFADFLIAKACSYISAYPKKGFSGALNIMMEELATNPFNFPGKMTNAVSMIALFTFFCVLIGMVINLQEKANRHVKQGTEEGTSMWMTDADPKLEKWNKTYSDPGGSPQKNGKQNAIMTQDIYLSMNTKQTRRNLNTLVVGGSGAGKSRFFVKPNLCEMPLNCNFICTDPSGELLSETGSMLEGAGYKVKVFNLVDMSESDRYNPLNYINCENDVILLVDCILANTTDPKKTGGDDFWEKAQKLMFQSLIFLVWEHGDEFHLEKNMNTIVTLMDGCKISEEETSDTNQGGRTAEYFDALQTKGWYFDNDNKFHVGKPEDSGQAPALMEGEAFYYHPPLENPEYDICIKQWIKFMAGAGKTLKSILISAMARLSTLDSPAVADLISEDNIELNKIGDEKTALFVIIPQEHESFNFLAAMLYTQLFQAMYYHAERECQGNYLVKDSNGELVKVFEISHKSVIEYEDDNAEEEEIEFIGNSSNYNTINNNNSNDNQEEEKEEELSENDLTDISNKNKSKKANEKSSEQEEKSNIASEDEKVMAESNFGISIDRKNTEIDESAGDVDDEKVESMANAFCERAKNAHCTKKGNKFLIKVPGVTPDAEEDIVGIYGNADFAAKRLKAIKDGCKVSRCGLHLPYHVRFMLDEFANIGKIPDFTKKLATCRKYSISASIILQSLQQIKTIYDKDWGTIVGNCDSFLFLGCQEIDTLEYVVKLLGKRTQRTRNESISKGGKGGTNMSYNFKGRDLMTADELRRLDNKDCVYILRGELPYKGRKHQFDNHPNYKYTADADSKNLYKFRPKPRKPKFEPMSETMDSSAFGRTTSPLIVENATSNNNANNNSNNNNNSINNFNNNNKPTAQKSNSKFSGNLSESTSNVASYENDTQSKKIAARQEEQARLSKINSPLDYNIANEGYYTYAKGLTNEFPITSVVDGYADSEIINHTSTHQDSTSENNESSSFGNGI